jgi:hypothetical protein
MNFTFTDICFGIGGLYILKQILELISSTEKLQKLNYLQDNDVNDQRTTICISMNLYNNLFIFKKLSLYFIVLVLHTFISLPFWLCCILGGIIYFSDSKKLYEYCDQLSENFVLSVSVIYQKLIKCIFDLTSSPSQLSEKNPDKNEGHIKTNNNTTTSSSSNSYNDFYSKNPIISKIFSFPKNIWSHLNTKVKTQNTPLTDKDSIIQTDINKSKIQ